VDSEGQLDESDETQVTIRNHIKKGRWQPIRRPPVHVPVSMIVDWIIPNLFIESPERAEYLCSSSHDTDKLIDLFEEINQITASERMFLPRLYAHVVGMSEDELRVWIHRGREAVAAAEHISLEVVCKRKMKSLGKMTRVKRRQTAGKHTRVESEVIEAVEAQQVPEKRFVGLRKIRNYIRDYSIVIPEDSIPRLVQVATQNLTNRGILKMKNGSFALKADALSKLSKSKKGRLKKRCENTDKDDCPPTSV
jgi:hypothetical protein